MRKVMIALFILFTLSLIVPIAAWAGSSGGGTRCDCDNCCKDSYTNKCYTCGPPPPDASMASASQDIKWLELIEERESQQTQAEECSLFR